MDETNLPLPFVKLFGMTSGASVRGTVGLILVRKDFNCFNFYSIDKKLTWGCFHGKNKNHKLSLHIHTVQPQAATLYY